VVDVVLVFMPYGTVDRPSIGLGYLSAALQKIDISCEIVHGNVLFAERIGLKSFNRLNGSSNIDLLGEWTFSAAAFPEFESSADAYFASLRNPCDPEEQQDTRRVRAMTVPFIEDLAQKIVTMKPRMVGCSSMFQQNTASLALLRRIRELAPEVISVMGGANCEQEVGRALHTHFPWIDYVFSGECDELFPEFCRRIFFGATGDYDGRPWPPTSIFTPETRTLGIDRPAGLELIHDMNRLPLPVFDDYFEEIVATGLDKKIAPALILETSRGCWWGERSKCTFCGLSAGTIGFRAKSPELAYQEIDQLYNKHHIRYFELVDNIMDNKYYDTLLPRLAEDGRDFRFFYEIKSNVSRKQVQQLADAGIVWIQPGIEGLNDRCLKLMKKGQFGLPQSTPAQVVASVRCLRDVELPVRYPRRAGRVACRRV
jgi:ribosomal peptide maturation radical SAM protein 1